MDRTHSHDVIVVGAGAIGLSIAWRAAQSQMHVALVDPTPGQGASWAAAGMLAPVSEIHYGEEALLALNLASSSRWPAFAAELEATTGRDVGYLRSGTLLVASDASDREWAQQLFSYQKELGLDVQWMSGRHLRELEPNVSPATSAGLHVPGDHQVDNRRLVEALIDAARTCGCCFYRSRAFLETAAATVTGVRLEDGETLEAPSVVLAAGAWSGQVGGIAEAARPAVRPVKGQILRLRSSGSPRLLTRCVRGLVGGADLYIVPRSDGSVVVGSTVEEMGFDTTVTAGAVYELLRDARRVVPGIAELELAELLAAARPGSPDNAPIIGEVASEVASGLILATGHYRNGILLTPVTSEAVVSMLTGRGAPEEVEAFSPSRFEVSSWSR